MLLVPSCSCLYPMRGSQVLSWEWRCSWSSADRRCSNYIWVIINLIAYWSATYIRDLTVLFTVFLMKPEYARKPRLIPRTHYSDVIMTAMAFQITGLTIVYSTVYLGVDQRSLAFVRGIHQWPGNSPQKWPVMRKLFPFDDVIMLLLNITWWRYQMETFSALLTICVGNSPATS